ncbi:MAG TPA: efflux RND transporter permease subunit, partial [Candidatus Baltobacteraceae bacterium]
MAHENMSLWSIAARARRPLFLAIAILCVLGVRSAMTAPESIFPPISLSRVEVFAHAGDLPPEAMLTQVTRPIEAALQSLPSIHEMRSDSTLGAVEIELDFDSKTDPRTDRQNVDAAVAAVRPRLPLLTSLETVIEHPNMEPVVSYGLLPAGISQARLRHLVESRITATFTGTAQLERVVVVGGPDLEETVALRPAALTRSGLSAQQVSDAITAANAVVAAGPIDANGERSVLAVGAALTPTTLANVAVPSAHGAVPLHALAQIATGDGPTTQQASVDGAHAVIINVYSVPNGDAVTLAREVAARMPGLLAALPAGTRVVKYWDQTVLIAHAIRALQIEMLVGALLALAVVFAFLRSPGLTLVTAITVPIAVFVTILAVVYSGMSLNLMSLGGLAIAIGLIIDETIVVVEAVAREWTQNPNAPREQTIRRALSRIAGPLVASTLAILVVFVPLSLLSGIPGAFFGALALTLGAALVVSISVSLGLAPALASLRATRGEPAAFVFERHYRALLTWMLDHRAFVFAGAAIVFAAGVILWTRLPNDFLPELDEGQFEIKYLFPAGTSLTKTDHLATLMERAILTDADVAHVGRLTGVDTNGYLPTPANGGTLRVILKPGAGTFDTVADRLRDDVNRVAPEAALEFHQLLED